MLFSHDAHCPEISPKHCADPAFEMVEHQHHQGIYLVRLQPSFSIGLGEGWQALARTPFDIKLVTIEYTTPDGAPYEPPYGDIHHRKETLLGLGDARLEIQRFVRAGEGWVVGGGLGSTVPLGRTEENPYALAAQSRTHQHLQMGTGTIDPIASATAIYAGHTWGFVSSASGSVPLYENSKGFYPSAEAQFSAGPTHRFSPKLMATGELSFKHVWQAKWDGEVDPITGRTSVDANVSLIQRMNPTMAVMVQGRTTLAQWSKEALLVQRFVGTVGLSYTPSGKAH